MILWLFLFLMVVFMGAAGSGGLALLVVAKLAIVALAATALGALVRPWTAKSTAELVERARGEMR